MSASQRRKGAEGEREVAALFQAAGYSEARRRASGEESQGDQGRDLGGVPFTVQVKIGARPNIHAAYDQARFVAPPQRPALALTRRDRRRWLVTMDAEEFLAIVFRSKATHDPATESRAKHVEGGSSGH